MTTRKNPAADLASACNRLGCTLEIDDNRKLETFTIDVWAPTGKLFGSNGSHVISHGFVGSTAYSKTSKDEARSEALADLLAQTIDDCEDEECEYCHAD
jgi:hypothetical protein